MVRLWLQQSPGALLCAPVSPQPSKELRILTTPALLQSARAKKIGFMDFRWLCRNAAQAQAAREQIRRSGYVGGHPIWIESEDAKIRTLYPDYRKLRRVLRRRTHSAILQRAQVLNVVKRRKSWLASDRSRLRGMYPTASWPELMAVFPERTKSAIGAMAWRIHAPRRAVPLRRTGLPITDAIRKKAREIGWSMTDLDHMARTKRYFRSGNFYSQKHPALLKALRALDARVTIEWP